MIREQLCVKLPARWSSFVEPSISVKSRVTVPLGASTIVGSTIARNEPNWKPRL
jgi:hypothetical protein